MKQSNLDVTLLVKSEGAKKIANLFFYPPKTLVFVSLKDLKKLLLKLKVDVVYHFDRSLGTVWASFNANIPWRFGIGTEGRWLFLSQILFKKKKEHHSHEHGRVFELSFKKLSHRYDLKQIISNWSNLTKYPLFKKEKFFETNKKYLLIHIGTTRPAKNIPIETYKNFIKLKKKEYSLIFLSGNDKEAEKELLPLVNKSYINQTTFEEFCHLIKRASEVISPDTSAMHIAAAYQVKVIGVFGSTEPNLTRPLGPTSKWVFKKVACSPCFRQACRFKKNDQKWMQCLKGLQI